MLVPDLVAPPQDHEPLLGRLPVLAGQTVELLPGLAGQGAADCGGGDPVAAARELAAEDVRAEVNVVGFDVAREAAEQLRRAAESGGGSYNDAAGASELEEIFRENYNWEVCGLLQLSLGQGARRVQRDLGRGKR